MENLVPFLSTKAVACISGLQFDFNRPSKFPAITVKFPHFCLLSRITHEMTFFPHFLNLTCRDFFMWGNYM
jgi:hypothetical protein